MARASHSRSRIWASRTPTFTGACCAPSRGRRSASSCTCGPEDVAAESADRRRRAADPGAGAARRPGATCARTSTPAASRRWRTSTASGPCTSSPPPGRRPSRRSPSTRRPSAGGGSSSRWPWPTSPTGCGRCKSSPRISDPDPAKVHLLLLSVAERFSSLADNAQAFMSALRRAIDFSDGDVDGFLAYKERLIDYINRFIADLANSGAQIARAARRAGEPPVTSGCWTSPRGGRRPTRCPRARTPPNPWPGQKSRRSTRGGTDGAGWTTGSRRGTRGTRRRPGCCGRRP